MSITDQFLNFLFLESLFPAINDLYLPGIIFTRQEWFLPGGNGIYRSNNDFYGSGNDFYRPGMVFTGPAMIFTGHKRCLPGLGFYLLSMNVVLPEKEHFFLAGTLFVVRH
jgi:hypothetical protein